MSRAVELSPQTAAIEPPARRAGFAPCTLAALVVYVVVIVRVAWVSDDAFITMRTVDNFVHGHGLRFNLDERVQTYTHPLWMLLLSATYALLRSPYFSLIVLGLASSLCAATFLARRLAHSDEAALAALLILSSSRSFVDYSTSGLENPLLHLLAAILVWLYSSRPAELRSFAIVLALLLCTRMDAGLVFAPALLHLCWLAQRARGLSAGMRELALGLSPFLCWELFSLLYYGFPFPNTAYAKLNTGISQWTLLQQGLIYLLGSLSWDPSTFAALGLGAALCATAPELSHKLLAAGAALYLLYVVKVGGDFMAGRFLSVPLFVLVCACARRPLRERAPLAKLALPFVLLLALPAAREEFDVVNNHQHSGVADERAFYRQATSLVLYARGARLPAHRWKQEGRALPPNAVSLVGAAGFRGFYAPRTAHIVDIFALTDPLLARLPAETNRSWRVGHYRRALPEGYLETLGGERCQLPSAALCAYCEQLRLVVRGELWSWARLRAIAALNLWQRSAPSER